MIRGAVSRQWHQRGVALAVVVWFIAGMSLLVAGVVLSARTDARLAQLHLARAQATAVGDGAVNLLLADVKEGLFSSEGGGRFAQQRYLLGDWQVDVVAVPMEWLGNINAASPALLANALQLSGAANAGSAEQLADAVVQWRSGAPGVPASRFEALEDLLDVPGMNRATWDVVRDFVAVPTGGAGLSGPDNRSRRALQRLRGLTPESRAAVGLSDTDRGAGRSGSGSYRVDAIVLIGDTRWLRRRWVTMSAGQSGLPWRVLRTEPARIISKRRD
jgi:hypothetical protein